MKLKQAVTQESKVQREKTIQSIKLSTHCFRFSKYDFIHCMTISENLQLCSLFRRMSCLTVSKAFLKSRYSLLPQSHNPCSPGAYCLQSVSSDFFRKPNFKGCNASLLEFRFLEKCSKMHCFIIFGHIQSVTCFKNRCYYSSFQNITEYFYTE